jgi:hypothetical protein
MERAERTEVHTEKSRLAACLAGPGVVDPGASRIKYLI